MTQPHFSSQCVRYIKVMDGDKKKLKVCKMLSICFYRDCGIRSFDRPLVAGRSYGPWILSYTDAVLGVGADY